MEPELKKMHVEFNLYEKPALMAQAQQAEKRELARIERKGNLRLLQGLGVLLIIAGLVLRPGLAPTIVMLGLGIALVAGGKMLVDRMSESEDSPRTRK